MESNVPFIVIVDDIVENVRILHHCLKDEGYSFAVARNAAELFEVLGSRAPTLVLLDVMLPDEDGFSILKRLRADPCWTDLPVIFVTARADRDDRLNGFLSGGMDYITKPFDAAEVRARVATHVALRVALETQRKLVGELRTALDRVKRLEDIIPICARCKSVRTDGGYWKQVESYLSEFAGLTFSHGLCPDCAKVVYPESAGDAEV
ncbi:MAG: response regulator [Treponemataceae bacterium]